jgi:hypothetical protein
MKNFKDTMVALSQMGWKHVLILLAIVGILLFGVWGVASITAKKSATEAATEAVAAQLAIQNQLHEYEINMRMENSAALNNSVLQLMYETKADRVLLAEYHNGSSNVSGVPFLKWSVTFESFRDEMAFGVANEYQQQQITLYPFITHIGDNYLYRGFVETDLKAIDKSYAYKLMAHKIEYIIVSQIVNDKGSKCGMLILEYTDASVINEYEVKQWLHKASQECAALLTLSHQSLPDLKVGK